MTSSSRVGVTPESRSSRLTGEAAVLAAGDPPRGDGSRAAPESGTERVAPPRAWPVAEPGCRPCSSPCDSCRRRRAYEGGSLIRLRTRCS
eukprot:5072260-Alexandrium_andersonii.AAC.1